MLSQLKRIARSNRHALHAVRTTYPALNWLRSRRAYYGRVAPYLGDMRFDDVRFSNRGNELDAHVRRTARYLELPSAKVLVLGVGDGRELDAWRASGVQSLTAVDALPSAAWSGRSDQFATMDVRALAFADESFDLVASAALLEHVDGVDACVREMARVTRPGGLVFANFGPLYRTYGGAHYLGAYEHLWMSDTEFESYLESRDIAYERAEGLFWLREGMFSRMNYDDYMAAFERHFRLAHVTIAVSRQALRYRRANPSQWAALRRRFPERDLLTYGMTVWMRPKKEALRTAGHSLLEAAA